MQISDVAKSVLSANRVLIIAGHGLRLARARHLFLETVTRFNLPYIITSHAKGYLPELQDQFIGVLGFGCDPEIEARILTMKPDLIVCIGTRLGDLTTLNWSPMLTQFSTIIQILNGVDEFNSAYTNTIQITADLREFLHAIWLESPINYGRSEPMRYEEGERDQNSDSRDQWPQTINLTRSPVDPQMLIECLGSKMELRSILVSDIGNSMSWIIRYLKVLPHFEVFIPLGYGSMGSGIGAAIGAQLANPDRSVICISGDCAFNMHGAEILTARELGLGLIIIVLNDGGHGMVDHGHQLIGLSEINVRFKSIVKYKLFAEAYGCAGYEVHTLQDFFNLDWVSFPKSKVPTIIDVRIDKNIVPPIKARAQIISQDQKLKKGEKIWC